MRDPLTWNLLFAPHKNIWFFNFFQGKMKVFSTKKCLSFRLLTFSSFEQNQFHRERKKFCLFLDVSFYFIYNIFCLLSHLVFASLTSYFQFTLNWDFTFLKALIKFLAKLRWSCLVMNMRGIETMSVTINLFNPINW